MKATKILSLTLFSLFIIGCSISEEITFNANGSINYSYLIDGSNFMEEIESEMGMASRKKTSAQDKKVRDTVIYLSRLYEEMKDSISTLSPEEVRENLTALEEIQEKLTALKPFILKVHDDGKKEYFVQLLGDFPNSTSLNSALSALSESSYRDSSTEILEFLANTPYGWDGKELRKTFVFPENIKSDSSAQSWLLMFKGGKYRAKYHFPKKVKKVSDSSAVISQDGKSVTIEYDASEYLTSSEKNNFIIELED
ncbi:MAG: hypothetical protein LBQ84_03195 [Flavobacteriaceae bacterium]|jgi:hypothetical protein|nr:hypothetical protein [Flavobacteriaceae bacterium]